MLVKRVSFFFLFSFYSELWRVDCLSFGFSRRLYAFPLDLELYIRLDIVLTLLDTSGDGETAFIFHVPDSAGDSW